MKLYILIQQLLRRKFVQYFVLFFILISIIAVIASSFEEMATYKVLLFGITSALLMCLLLFFLLNTQPVSYLHRHSIPV